MKSACLPLAKSFCSKRVDARRGTVREAGEIQSREGAESQGREGAGGEMDPEGTFKRCCTQNAGADQVQQGNHLLTTVLTLQ